MADFKTCPHCGKASGRDTMGRAMKLCGSEDCSRAASRERSRAFRERRKTAQEPPKRRTTKPKATPYSKGMHTLAGPVLAPWGQTYDTAQAMWGDVLLFGGADNTVTEAQQRQWSALLELAEA